MTPKITVLCMVFITKHLFHHFQVIPFIVFIKFVLRRTLSYCFRELCGKCMLTSDCRQHSWLASSFPWMPHITNGLCVNAHWDTDTWQWRGSYRKWTLQIAQVSLFSRTQAHLLIPFFISWSTFLHRGRIGSDNCILNKHTGLDLSGPEKIERMRTTLMKTSVSRHLALGYYKLNELNSGLHVYRQLLSFDPNLTPQTHNIFLIPLLQNSS